MRLLNPRLLTYPAAKSSCHSLSGLFRFPAPLTNPTVHLRSNYCRRRRRCFSSSSTSPVRETMTMPPSQRNVHVKDQIDLTDKEKQIFDCLLEVLRKFNLQTQLRVAGGWVRDKLLGKECYDIDVALDNMMGREFCEKVNEYMLSTGEEARGVGVIQSNPDQSKHLETATMRLFDEWIDFVNLRSEDYSETSRIPTMRFGTAEEDAYRRDLTINSLFYNINTNSVEDFTGRGISDLKSGKIVTPLPPKQTFLDDPLRVLRAIRFGARFGFELDGDLKVAASDDDVKAAIASKISRERIGKEVDLMMSGNQPVLSMSYICELQLFWIIFNHPPDTEFLSREGLERLSVDYVDFSWQLLQLLDSSTFTNDHCRLGLYAALFLPFRNAVYTDNKGKTIPVVSHIFRTSLKLKSSDADSVIKMHVAANKLLSLIPSIMASKKSPPLDVNWKRQLLDVPGPENLRVLAGLVLREIKELWRPSLLLSLLLYPEDIGSSGKSSNEDSELNLRRDIFTCIENEICDMGLDKIWELKPLVNGKDIMSILHIKPGPDVKEWQEKLMEWQLAHPIGSAEECIEWMKQAHQSKRARTE